MSSPHEPGATDRGTTEPGAAGRRAGSRRAAVAALLALLGFSLAAELHHGGGRSAALEGVRQDDLVRILAQTDAERQREQAELTRLQALRERLASAPTRRAAALEAERQRAQVLGVLAGTTGVSGPGVSLTVDDRRRGVRADVLLDAVEELRDAGAVAMQLGSVRVVASTWLLDAPGGGVTVDGAVLQPPYRLLAVGDARTMAAALAIPGGVEDTVARAGGTATVAQSARVRISALRPFSAPHYARPAAG